MSNNKKNKPGKTSDDDEPSGIHFCSTNSPLGPLLLLQMLQEHEEKEKNKDKTQEKPKDNNPNRRPPCAKCKEKSASDSDSDSDSDSNRREGVRMSPATFRVLEPVFKHINEVEDAKRDLAVQCKANDVLLHCVVAKAEGRKCKINLLKQQNAVLTKELARVKQERDDLRAAASSQATSH